jgi:steroid 5-alpha reductase family enzyme
MIELLLLPFIAALVWMFVLWLYQVLRCDATCVDIGWAAGLGFIAIGFAAIADAPIDRRWFVAVLAAIWAFRLAFYLLLHRAWGHGEDGRYRRLREHWGQRANLGFFALFEAQAVLILLFGVVFLAAMNVDAPVGRIWDFVGVAVWLLSVGGEALADRQLAGFRDRPENRGHVCRAGLWRYSRHPNYFFEWLHWWTYVILAIGSPWWPVTLLGPVLMLLFLLFVTGIPATEAHILQTRGDEYRKYQQTTSPFIPWFPRKEPT